MARPPRSGGVEKMLRLGTVSNEIGKGLGKRSQQSLRTAFAPVVPDAQGRYRSLGREQAKQARTVRMSVSQRSVTLSAGGTPTWGASEFGANRTSTRSVVWRNQFGRGIDFTGAKRIDYSRQFGSFTGTTGKAFVPAVRRGMRRANTELEDMLGDAVTRLAQSI